MMMLAEIDPEYAAKCELQESKSDYEGTPHESVS